MAVSSFAAQAKASGLEIKEKQAFASSTTWYEEDRVVTLVPKFKIKKEEGMREKYIELLPKFLEAVKEKEMSYCVHYSFVGPSEDGYVICREGYTSAEGVLSHLNVVGELLAEAQKYADIVELSVQGPAEELEKLKEPLASMNAVHYPIFPGGIRNTKQW